mmetsp:Transcript_52976/g.141889  ORF Transcript_52976/g.141889 Transcript_52976/m.141889 type:complete len:236 (+) Transcript_52976:261-968(+)
MRILLQESVQPFEGPLVRQTNGEHDIKLGVRLGRSCDNHVSLRSALHHPASEGQRLCWLRPKEHLHGDATEGDVRVKRLPDQVLGQGLRLGDALPLTEQADGVHVGARWVQVQNHSDDLVARESLRSLNLLVLGRDIEAFRVKVSSVIAVTQKRRRVLCGETQAHELPRHGHAAALPARGLGGVQGLDNLHLVHVAAGLQAHVRTCTCNQILHAALRHGHEELPTGGRHDIQGGV